MGTKINSNYSDLLTFTRASKGHALRPVSYGTELVDDGTFDEGTVPSGWEINTANGVLSIVNGALQARDTNGDQYIADYELTNLKVGGIYKVEYTDSGYNSMALSSSRGAHTDFITLPTTDGFNQVYVVATRSTLYLGFRRNNGITETIDNVSVKEVFFDQPDGTLTLFEHPNNVPRVEYDADGNRLGLLVEEQRVNKVTYSEDASQYTKTNSPTITTNIAIAPDGTETVDGIQDASGGAFRRAKMFQGSVTANSTHTGSLFVKKETSETNYGGLTLNFTGGTSKTCYGIIDAVNGTITAPSSGNNITPTFTTIEVGDFWRFSITATDTGSNTQLEFGVYGTLSPNGTDLGLGAGSVRRIWGAQLEAGSFPTSYMKNEGAPSGATRSADVASIPVADFGYNDDVGTVVINFKIDDSSSNKRLVSLNAGNNNNRMDALLVPSNTAQVYVMDGGVNQTNLNSSTTYADKNMAKVAFSYKKDDYVVTLDSGAIASDTSATVPTVTTFTVGTGPAAAPINGYIKSIQYYPRRLTNAQLEALTEPRSTPTLSLTFDGLESSYTENYIHG